MRNMNLNASVNYHIKSELPQAFEFDVDGIVGNLISPELVTTNVVVKDVRDNLCNVSFNNDGIAFVKAPTAVTKFDESQTWQDLYNQEVSALLTREIAAKEVIVFDHTVRIDDQQAARKPARNVHNDYSAAGAQQRLIDLVGEQKAAQLQDGAFAFVNVWRPVESPITSSPLGFIRPSSMNADDWMNIELIYPDRRGQILGVAANPNHEWFYQSHMHPDEAAIFNIFDNRGRPYLAHSALDIAGQEHSPKPRKSIETRTLVIYDNYIT